MNEKLKNYPKTEHFEVVDTMGVPHPFCITHHHIAFESESVYLDGKRIKRYEKSIGNRPSCGMKGCNLMYDQHEQALAVRCKTGDKDLLKTYLESIVKQCEADGFAGFVLIDAFSKGENQNG